MYEKHFNTRQTPQDQPIPGESQVKNNAGGFVYALDAWDRLDRFLILGTEGGTYYVGEHNYTVENLNHVRQLIETDGFRVIKRIVEVSQSGRSMKNDAALFALAMCTKFGNVQVRKQAAGVLPLVARIGTHLLTFVKYRRAMGGFGRLMREAIQNWYLSKPDDKLAWQLLKYQSRGGWSHADVFRMVHPTPQTTRQDFLFGMQTGKHPANEIQDDSGFFAASPPVMSGFIQLRNGSVTTPRAAAKLISELKLPWEVVPTELHGSPEVWEALLPHMPYTALVRNLNRLTSLGVIKPLSATTEEVVSRLSDPGMVRAARFHPMNGLVAAKTYGAGRGMRGSLTWNPVPDVVDALERATQHGFSIIEPAGKRFLLGVDVSGSMGAPMGGSMLTCAEAAAAMALILAKTEPRTYIYGFENRFAPLDITPRDTFRSAAQKAFCRTFGRTDCALPMQFATENKLDVDCFVVLTDNETWAGRSQHPVQALRVYRSRSGIPAKLIVVGMTASGFTIADPDDSGMLDVVGGDASLPTLVSRFAGGLAEK